MVAATTTTMPPEQNHDTSDDQNQQRRSEIYTYEAPWHIYAMNWSVRKDKKYRLAIASLLEQYPNRVEIVQLDDTNGEIRPDPNLSFEHPYPPTKLIFIPDKECQKPDLLATSSDFLRIWRIGNEDDVSNDGGAGNGRVEMKSLLNNNRNSEFCGPVTSFDWNEGDPRRIGTSSIDTTCTIWDIERETVDTQLIAHDKEVYDIAWGGVGVFASVSADGSVRVFDLRDKEHSTIIYESSEPDTPLVRLGWNKQDPRYMATIIMDSAKVVVLDIRFPTLPVVELQRHQTSVNAIAWAPHSSCHICTAGDDSQALIWDLSSMGQPVEGGLDPILAYTAGASINYSFPSHEEGWMVTKSRKKNKAMRCNSMVAVDCEMVLCEDGTDALVRVCVVDRDLNVKLDELVKPDGAVADYRTHITGVAAKDLEQVTCSLQDVQVSMMKLLARGTILVGHSLNNDLQALKVDHTRVIDTSLVFKYWSGSNFRRPSLNDLCKTVLGYELRKEGEPHDCVEDARAAMKLVLAKIETGVDDAAPLQQNAVNETDGTKLLCHRIPISIPGEKLLEVIPGDFTVEVKTSKKAGGDKYSAFAVFKTKQEADQAFESFDVEQVKDSSGRPQKFISFKLDSGLAGSLYVRKMVQDGINIVQVASNKRPSEDDIIPTQPKKLKTDETPLEPKEMVCNKCDGYLKEIESLKKIVSERDQEISMLHKLIVSQARKQSGL